MKTLAIETSCDDTSLAIVSYEEGGTFTVEQLLAYSQVANHQQFGGVVPEIASRLHSEKIIAILQHLGRKHIQEVDFISVTTHPGLPGSLVVGKAVATMLAEYFQKPLVEVNHIHGHIFSLLLERKLTDITFPMVILTASGGHNDVYLVTRSPFGKEEGNEATGDFTRHIEKLAYTLDDASGEAFDKVSKMLGGPYPGGPRISEQAEQGKPNPAYHFKRIFLPQDKAGNYPFSFSGMKSQVSFLLEKIKKAGKALNEQDIANIAYEFQEATVETLAKRLIKIAKEQGATTVAVAGGVSANNRLIACIQQLIEQHNTNLPKSLPRMKLQDPEPPFQHLTFLYPTKKIYSTDNGAMIGAAGILEMRDMHQQLQLIVQTLNNDGVILLPTDTVYGLAALASSQVAVEKIYTLKNRPKEMLLPIMVAGEEGLEALGLEVNEAAKKLLQSDLVPGAVSFVLGFKNEEKKPDWAKNLPDLAIRIPDDALLLAVLRETGPLAVTSANRNGKPTPATVAEIVAELDGKPDLVIAGGKGKEIASTIVSFRFSPPKILRLGAVSEERIRKLYE